MTKALATAPHHNKGFIIMPPPRVEDSEFPLQFSFYGYTHADTHRVTDRRGDYYIGCLVGDPYKDDTFRKKLERVRAIMHLRGLLHVQEVCRLNLKKVQRMGNEQKYQRKLTRVRNEYGRRRNLLSGTLFAAERIAELEADYQKTVIVLKQRYCIDG